MERYKLYDEIIKEELILATGCTEPIALAYLAAIANEQLDGEITSVKVSCSPNIVKNVKSVTIPNTGGLKGIEAAIITGLVAGVASKKLEVITSINDQQRSRINELLKQEFVKVSCLCDEPNLSVNLELFSEGHHVVAKIMHTHTNLTYLEKDGVVVFQNLCDGEDFNSVLIDRTVLTIEGILDYAAKADLTAIRPLLEQQIAVNMTIANEGINHVYGANVGQTILANNEGVYFKGIAFAAAASDARMSGCKYPVMTNSGSGNQGITASIPLIVYAQENNVPLDDLIKALVVSNLITIHIKSGIGRLSAYCGVVCAATATFAGIAFLDGETTETIYKVITNSLATCSGMICDGAKESCASKISTALFSAMLARQMAHSQLCFEPDCGIVQKNIEKTIEVVGYLGREGMKQTDEIVLNIMTKER